jgi:pectate lyase
MLFHPSVLFTLATASLTAAQLAGYATQNGGTTGGAGGTTTTVSAAAAFQTAVKVCVRSNFIYPDVEPHSVFFRRSNLSQFSSLRQSISPRRPVSVGIILRTLPWFLAHVCYRPASDTTIIGVGTQAILTGVGLKISGQKNIIIRNLVINKVIPFSTSVLSLPHRKTGGHGQ